MQQFLIKKDGKYCTFFEYQEDIPLLNVAQYLVDKNYISEPVEQDFILDTLTCAHFTVNSFNNFYQIKFISYCVSSKKDIYANLDDKYQFKHLQENFFKLLEVKARLTQIANIVKKHKKIVNSITNHKFKNYFNYDFIFNNYKYEQNNYRWMEETLKKDYAKGFVVNNTSFKKLYQALSKEINLWKCILDEKAQVIDIELLDDVDNFGSKEIYALFTNWGAKQGFYSGHHQDLVDISRAKTFSSLEKAQQYVKNTSSLQDVAYVKVALNFVQIEHIDGSVNTHCLDNVNSHFEKEKLQNIKSKEALAQELLALCGEQDEEIKLVLEKMLNKNTVVVQKKIKI